MLLQSLLAQTVWLSDVLYGIIFHVLLQFSATHSVDFDSCCSYIDFNDLCEML
jgi:hypothetical protein